MTREVEYIRGACRERWSILEVYDERVEYTRECMTREVSLLEVYHERGEYTGSVSRER